MGLKESERQFEQIRRAKSGSVEKLTMKKPLSDFVPSRVVTAPMATSLFVAEVSRMMPYVQAVFLLCALGCAVFAMDMNYPWGNDGSSWGAYGLFHLFASSGEVFAGQAFTSKSPSEMGMPFAKLVKAKEGDPVKVAAVMTDQPRVDQAMVHAVLGMEVGVRKDVL